MRNTIIFLVLFGTFFFGCVAPGGGAAPGGLEALQAVEGSYSGTFAPVPANSRPDLNGDIFFEIRNNVVTGRTVTDSGMESSLTGILNGTEIQAKAVTAGYPDCTFIGTLSKVTVAGGQLVPGFSGTSICGGGPINAGGITVDYWTWTANKVS